MFLGNRRGNPVAPCDRRVGTEMSDELHMSTMTEEYAEVEVGRNRRT